MQQTVIAPADLGGQPLEELKRWLGISRPQEDTLLVGLLHTSLGLCEAFTRQSPLEQTVEETVASVSNIYELRSRPVKSLVTATGLSGDGTRTPLAAEAIRLTIDGAGKARLELDHDLRPEAIAVSVRAGIAQDWAALPDALRHGMIRLAAFHYRDRESGQGTAPPASVAALWRPWRLVQLA
jgi:uncharacterized phiE125 gp8 family phage protein